MRTHPGTRPHACEARGKAFTEPGSLAKDRRAHSGERPHVCETCGKAFSQSGHLAHAHAHKCVTVSLASTNRGLVEGERCVVGS